MADLGKIRTIARMKEIPLGELASRVGISEQGMYRLIRDNSTKVETLERIAIALGVSVTVFFSKEALANSEEPGNIDVEEQRKLTAEAMRQNAELIEIVKKLTNGF